MSFPAAETGANEAGGLGSAVARETGNPLAAVFGDALFRDVDQTEVKSYGESERLAFARRAFDTFAMRPDSQPVIATSIRQAKNATFLAVDIVNDDMPFLVDSVLAALRDMGYAPEFVAHPVFDVERDREGRLVRLSQGHANGSRRESFIHLHIRQFGKAIPEDEIVATIAQVLSDVKTVVTDFAPMSDRLDRAIADFEQNPPAATVETNAESLQFLRWLAAGNFIFLGVREYAYTGSINDGELSPRPELSLGLLRKADLAILRRGGMERRLNAESRSFFLSAPPVIVAKASSKSTVHRRVHMDTIGIKLYDRDKRVAGELRLAGLFTASAYNLSTRNIPVLRLKVDKVLQAAGHAPDSYSGRALLNVLESYPRDELFQIGSEDLSRIATEILKIELTPRPRAFVRRDGFQRFVSVLVYVPRERYSTDVRVRLSGMLERVFGGHFDSFTPFFPEGPTVRIHFVIWRGDNELKAVGEAEIEREVEKIVRTWHDEFRSRAIATFGNAAPALIEKYDGAFPAGYADANRPSRAVEDVQRLERLSPEKPIDVDLYRDDMTAPEIVRATFQQRGAPISLSRRVPILENFGFDVVSERTFLLTPRGADGVEQIFVHDSELKLADDSTGEFTTRRANLESGFLAVWANRAANDKFNGLILRAGLNWREVSLLRAYAGYLRQTGASFGLAYVSEVLNKHPGVTSDLFLLFDTLFNPASNATPELRAEEAAKITQRITSALDKIPVLEEDRVLRSLLSVIQASLRTNYYQRTDTGGVPETIAFKLRSGQIEWLVAPKPYAEIFVSSPRFEGVHLRFGPIARGGLRWSDRPQDFRTEILGLVKAQQVKNVVIVPQGAKGGFVPRNLPVGRDAIQAEGVACYKSFINTLLSITDNVVAGTVVPPANTVRRDGDDPYLVVAADKGTATFSDIANEIAVGRKFWLGDAFASGGSAGYDHKKMAITARGAWEAVKRHFREMNVDIQTTPFTVVGVGDMSGDVFGNGMLLSPAIKLVAAFDHRDIFIDPNPDPAISFAERQRLFDLPRSSWQDYDRSKLSPGGGIYSRNEKSIALSPEAQAALDLPPRAAATEIMSAILKARADLLWFGGIGTYIRASTETDALVGDRNNDAIRVSAPEVRSKVIGEGANLGMTQRARIEYGLSGGRVNTDAIDNSAGVNTSDIEVNIKIALGSAVSAGKLTLAERNAILADMTDDVAKAVLRNNYRQTLAISLGQARGLSDIGFQQRMIQHLEKDGTLDHTLEVLPTDAQFRTRRSANQPLTRPELAVLLAYAKIDLERALVHSQVPDDPYFSKALKAYFPPLMRDRFAAEIEGHQLRREIIATSLTNDIINRGGSTFVIRLKEETGFSAADIAYAFAAAMAVYNLDSLFRAIDELDGRIDGGVQLALYLRLQTHLREQTTWFLRHGLSEDNLEAEITRYKGGVDFLSTSMFASLKQREREALAADEAQLQAQGVPTEIAARVASLRPLVQALDVVRVAQEANASLPAASEAVFGVREALRLDALSAASEQLATADYYDRLAVNSSLATLSTAQRHLSRSVLRADQANGSFAAWYSQHEESVGRTMRGIDQILESVPMSLSKLTVAIAQVQTLAALEPSS
jgi:glutamate dehydrogenase